MSDEATTALPEELTALEREALAEFAAVDREERLRQIASSWVGANGRIKALQKRIPQLEPAERKAFGQATNALRARVEGALAAAEQRLEEAALEAELNCRPIDVTLPPRNHTPGSVHPIPQMSRELLRIFAGLGFEVVSGPLVDDYANNFEGLAFPPDHPATDMQDSFFVSWPGFDAAKRPLLRTHTSNVQVHELRSRKPPMAVVSAGPVFRRDDDITHSPMFAQLEGFWVGEGIHFGHLRATLTAFVQALFGEATRVRLRPSYFPFVEPGAELDISCPFCPPEGGCRVCKDSRWVEVLGCGMIHPRVLELAEIDSERYTGFAFGLGIDRLAMLRHHVRDIRWLYENNPSFLSAFEARLAGEVKD